jgi:hypothetical protein
MRRAEFYKEDLAKASLVEGGFFVRFLEIIDMIEAERGLPLC